MKLLDRLMESCDLSTLAGKTHFFNVTAKHVARLADPAERELYTRRVAQSMGFSVETVRWLFGKAAGE